MSDHLAHRTHIPAGNGRVNRVSTGLCGECEYYVYHEAHSPFEAARVTMENVSDTSKHISVLHVHTGSHGQVYVIWLQHASRLGHRGGRTSQANRVQMVLGNSLN